MNQKQSKAVSSQYTVECPQCHAAPNQPCRTLRTGRVTDTHLSRIDKQYEGKRVL